MPVSLEESAALAHRAARLAAQAELDMLQKIAARMRRSAAAPTWMQEALLEVQGLRRELVRELGRLDTRLAAEIERTVADAYDRGMREARRDADAPRPPLARRGAVEQLARDTLETVRPLYAATLRHATDAFQAAAAEGAAGVLGGAATRLEATQRALDRLLGQGIKGYRDAAGREWALESYTEMAVRTAAARSALDGHIDTLTANDMDLVYIIPGPRACPLCDGWAGSVLSISGATQGGVVRTTLDDARSQGWGHPNCRCSVGAYLPGFTQPRVDRSSAEAYEAGQQQRALERGIRHWKRREALALTPEARAAARRKQREWQARMRAHLADNPELRRRPERERGPGKAR